MLDIKIHNAAIKEKCRDESDMSCNQKTFEFLQKHYKEFIIKNEDGHFHWYNHSYALNIHILDTLKDGEFFIENQIGQGFGVIVNVNMEEEEERIKLEEQEKEWPSKCPSCNKESDEMGSWYISEPSHMSNHDWGICWKCNYPHPTLHRLKRSDKVITNLMEQLEWHRDNRYKLLVQLEKKENIE